MKVQILTTQNVEIEYETASLGERIGATLIDMLILFAYSFVVLAGVVQSIAHRSDDTAFTLMVVLVLPVLLYDLLCEIFMDGQSLGKKALKIKVVKLDGTQPGIGSYLLRWLLRFVEVWGSSGVIAAVVILVNGKGQRLGDLAAGTTVVKLKPTATLADTIFAQIDPDYVPTFPQVTRLNDRDIAVIKEVINSREQRQNPVVLNTLVRKVKEVLEVDTDLSAPKFLKTVVKDYNHYVGGLDA